MELLELAERCEAAKGADRDMDELIAAAMSDAVREVQPGGKAAYYHKSGSPWVAVHVPDPGYTASIDAAMSLVDLDYGADGNGHAWFPYIDRVSHDYGRDIHWVAWLRRTPDRWMGKGASPALALIAAVLRSRHALEQR